MKVKIEESWNQQLSEEFSKEYFKNLVEFVKQEYATKTIYPPAKRIFSAFDHCPFDNVKVVIIGQDPYHGPGQANGLCFSVYKGVNPPPSLKNIFKELQQDLGGAFPQHGDLTCWSEQGVLLLNATLTVAAHTPGSHQNRGWEAFTDAVIQKISGGKQDIVFILWGAYAQRKGDVIDRSRHEVIASPHPSPFSANRGFFGSKPFSKTNDYLKRKGLKPIDWKVE